VYAYEHGKQGDTFIKKAPASTIAVLATAVMEIFGVDGNMQIIGTRHGEKRYETLVTREEMARFGVLLSRALRRSVAQPYSLFQRG